MNVFNTAILTASVIGIISTFIDFTAPGEIMKKQLKMIITMVMILGVFTPFLGKGFKISLNEISDLKENSIYGETEKDFNDYYLETTAKQIEQRVIQSLEEKNISVNNVSINLEMDEYNLIDIKKAQVHADNLNDDQVQEAKNIIEGILPNTEVEFIQEESSEVE